MARSSEPRIEEEKLLDVLSVRIGPTLREALEREARYLDSSLSTHARKILESYARGRNSGHGVEGMGPELLEVIEREMRELLARLARRIRSMELARRRGRGEESNEDEP